MNWPLCSEFKTFYASHLGQVCSYHLRKKILEIWPHAKNETILFLGYGLPIMRPYLKSADVLGAIIPHAMGYMAWPNDDTLNYAISSDENMLPFLSGTVNRIVLMHSLEYAQPVATMLAEAQRCLTPSGRLLVMVPNRLSFWARAEHTPFAHGQPYSLNQLKKLFDDDAFRLVSTHQCLFFPPTKKRAFLKFSRIYERLGKRFFPHFGGMLVMEYSKSVLEPLKENTVKATLTEAQPVRANIRKSF